jgi:aerobic carbon-monoxide dehydrogenase small subunit
MSEKLPISLTINGEATDTYASPRETLADFLRRDLQLTGTHLGCEMGACGACLVLLDGLPVHACLMFAVQADGANIETIEGLSDSGVIADIQKAFHERNALQCGFCTSGILVTAHHLLRTTRNPSREEIRDALSGNYCRCTGYMAIVDAIEEVSASRRDAVSERAIEKAEP